MKYWYSLILAFTLVAGSSSADGQALYAQFDGIVGESNNVDHQDWIDVLSYSQGISNQFIIGNLPGTPLLAPIQLTKEIDLSSTSLISALTNGTRINDAVIEQTSNLGGSAEVYYRVNLDGVYITSYSASASGGALGPVTETIALLFEKIKITYWPNDGGVLGTPTVVTWDVLNETQLAASTVALTVRADGNDVIFGWQTLSESGNYGFEVQHRENGEYKRAAYVPATGWSSQPLEYQVRVRGLEEGIHVFRLASLALGGAVSYSTEMTVSLGVPDGLTLVLDEPYPNPFTDRTNIGISVAQDEHARVSLFDMLGREVAIVYDGPLQSGQKSRFVVDPETALPSGMYSIRVKTDRDVATRMVSVGH